MILQKYKNYKIIKIIKFLYAHTFYSPPKKFKKAFIKLWKVYPYGFIPKKDIQKLIPPRVLNDLFIDSFIKDSRSEKVGNVLSLELGHSSLPLISMWKVERLTKWLIILTIGLIILTLKMIEVF